MKLQRTRNVRRDTGTVEGMEITGIENAKFISVVKRPANQRPFSVIRSADGKEAPTKARVGRTKRNDSQQVAKVSFPVDYTDEQVTEALKSYGLVGFEIARSDDALSAARPDLQSIAADTLTDIPLTADGIVAQVVRNDAPVTGKNQLAVTSFEFNSDTFSRSDAVAWLEENEVDFDDKALDNSSGNFVLQRGDAGDGEVRHLELAEGVVAHVTRADAEDIPEGFVLVVNEAAWSGWGWGMLDFESKLAGVEVGGKLREGLCMLEDILRDVLFYSSLPIDSRKELAQRSLQQFGVYAGNLLDQLPRQLLIQVGSAQRNDDKAQEPVMTTEKKDTTATTEADKQTLTRGDAKLLIAEVLREAGVTKAEPVVTEPVVAATVQEPATTGLTREDFASIIGEALKPVTERLDKVESTVVVRSDANDPVVEPVEENLSDVQKKVKREDAFKGTMPKLFG